MIEMKPVKLSLLAFFCLASCSFSLLGLAEEQIPASPSQIQSTPQPLAPPPVDQLGEPEIESFFEAGRQKKLNNAASPPNETTDKQPPATSPEDSPSPTTLEVDLQPAAPETVSVVSNPPSENNQQVVSTSTESPAPSQVPVEIINASKEVLDEIATLVNQATPPAQLQEANIAPSNQLSQSQVSQDTTQKIEKIEEPNTNPVQVVTELDSDSSSNNSSSSPDPQTGIQPPVSDTFTHSVGLVFTNTSTSAQQSSPQDTHNQNAEIIPIGVDHVESQANQDSAQTSSQPAQILPPRLNLNTSIQTTENEAPMEVVMTVNEGTVLINSDPVSTRNTNEELKGNPIAHVANTSISSLEKNVSEILPVAMDLASSGKENEKSDKTQDETQSSGFPYTLDKGNCQESRIPELIIRESIEKILSQYLASNCTDKIKFKLGPFENKRIRGFVMETSPTVLSLSQLLQPKLPILVQCHNISSSVNETINFNLNLSISSQDAWLEGRWRKYPQTKNLDEIPIELPGENSKLKSLLNGPPSFSTSSSSSSSSQSSLLSASTKCQPFKIQGGSFKFGLTNLETQVSYLISLKKPEQTGTLQPSRVRVQHFRLKRLHLAPLKLLIGGGGADGDMANISEAPATVQILHDQNNHHRRNNWLLDLYANWLRHEYRVQLHRQLSQSNTSLLERLNGSCKLLG